MKPLALARRQKGAVKLGFQVKPLVRHWHALRSACMLVATSGAEIASDSPAAVIFTLAISSRCPPATTRSAFALASPPRTSRTSISVVNPCASMSASVQPVVEA